MIPKKAAVRPLQNLILNINSDANVDVIGLKVNTATILHFNHGHN